MDSVEYLRASFTNIQELIRFTDQKVASALIVSGIEIGIFYELSKDMAISIANASILPIVSAILGAAFVVTMVVMLCTSIFGVLRPRTAKHYKGNEYSTFYYEHIARFDKATLETAIQKLDGETQEAELAGQLYEVAKILDKKNRNCSRVLALLFASILILGAYVLFLSLL